jgi:hypothetical protein
MEHDPLANALLTGCSYSTQMLAKTLFPERFTLPFAENVHGKIFEKIDGPSY